MYIKNMFYTCIAMLLCTSRDLLYQDICTYSGMNLFMPPCMDVYHVRTYVSGPFNPTFNCSMLSTFLMYIHISVNHVRFFAYTYVKVRPICIYTCTHSCMYLLK